MLAASNDDTGGFLETFKSTDIGAPRLQGRAALEDGGLVVTAGGADIWGTRDEFHFAYVVGEGDLDVRTRIEGLTFADPYSKAGIMVRGDADEDAPHAYFQIFPDNSPRNNNNGGYELQYRKVRGGEMRAIYPATSIGEPAFPVNFPDAWMRVTRIGDVFTGYWSANGTDWTVYGSLPVVLGRACLVGFAVTSHDVDRLATARFDDITHVRI